MGFFYWSYMFLLKPPAYVLLLLAIMTHWPPFSTVILKLVLPPGERLNFTEPTGYLLQHTTTTHHFIAIFGKNTHT